MELAQWGGVTRDGQPTRTCVIRCATAHEQWMAARKEAERAVDDMYRDHVRPVTAPWPLPQAAEETT